MDQKSVLKIINNYIKKIPKKYGLLSAYLFGSYAKGNFNEESDIDIALIIKNLEDDFQTQVELMKIRRDIDIRIEPHPIKEKDFNINNPLYNEIQKYGLKIIISNE